MVGKSFCLFFSLVIAMSLMSCRTTKFTEEQSFLRSVEKDLPFRVDSLRYSENSDYVELRFANKDYIVAAPDLEIDHEGKVEVYRTFDKEPSSRQSRLVVWRNVVVSKKHQRIICIDRYHRHGRTEGYISVFQSKSKKYPTYGTFHWDVSDSHLIEFTGMMVHNLQKLATQRIK